MRLSKFVTTPKLSLNLEACGKLRKVGSPKAAQHVGTSLNLG